MKIRSLLACGALALAVAGGSVATSGAAVAAPKAPGPAIATGSIALASPTQYEVFTAIPGHGRYHGYVDYANFTYPVTAPVHTNVWNITGTHALTFYVGTTPYAHTVDVATLTPLSTHSYRFTGTGSTTGYTWTITGTVNWNAVSFVIAYNGSTYRVTAHGLIKPDGSVTGTAVDTSKVALTFTMPAGSAFQVLRYTAPVTWAAVYAHHNASFVFTIPKGMPAGLAGLRIIVKVHEGGPGFKHDTYAAGVATSPHNGPVTYYPITSGYIFVS